MDVFSHLGWVVAKMRCSTGIINKNLNYKKEMIKDQEFGYSVCILLCYQAAEAYVPRDMCLCVASVLCLSINILERSSTW